MYVGVATTIQALRSLWQMLSKRVSDYDELKMASTRMRYMTQTEMTEGTSDPSAVSPLFVIVKKDDFESDGRAAAAELERCLRQVVYLNNLAKVRAEYTVNPDAQLSI